MEEKHATFFVETLNRLGNKPYKIDSLISYITGHIPGIITPHIGSENLFYFNYKLED